MQFDKSTYRPGLELTQDCAGAELVLGTGKSAAAGALVTKGASAQEIVDAVAARNGLPSLANLKAASVLLGEIESMIGKVRQQQQEEAWARYRTSGVMAPPPGR